jgi:hypothetical protein
MAVNNLSAVESIFFAALEKGTPEARAAYLDEACGRGSELRGCVERLLQAHPKVGDFLQAQPGPVPTVDDRPLTEDPGTRIGQYKLLQQIGEGGMGVVYMAEQEEPVRRPAGSSWPDALGVQMPYRDAEKLFQTERWDEVVNLVKA